MSREASVFFVKKYQKHPHSQYAFKIEKLCIMNYALWIIFITFAEQNYNKHTNNESETICQMGRR